MLCNEGLRKLDTKTLPGGGTYNYDYDLVTGAPYAGMACALKDDLNSVSMRLASITDDAGHTVNYSLNFWGSVYYQDVSWASGAQKLATYYTFDSTSSSYTRFMLGSIRTTLTETTGGTSTTYTLNKNAYTYDAVGSRQTNTVSGDPEKTGTVTTYRTEQYDYDDLYRLTSVNYGDGQSQSYTFDNMGNRLTKVDTQGGSTSYAYNNANMLTSAGGSTYTNDIDGNTLTGGGRTNTWDSQNRLTQCVYNGTTSTFTYGSDGLRRSMTRGGNTTYYALDGQNVAREMTRDANSTLINKATYFIGARGPEYRRDDLNNTYAWYVYDSLGPVVGEVDDSGNMPVPRAYDVYGFVCFGDSGSSTQKFCGSLGHMSEDNTGLIYMRARYMDPVLGRFTSEDPSRNGSNWFVYCNGNPVNSVDLSGKTCLSDVLVSTELQDGLEGAAGDVSEGMAKQFAHKLVCLMWDWADACLVFVEGDMEIYGSSEADAPFRIMMHLRDAEPPHIQLFMEGNREWELLSKL